MTIHAKYAGKCCKCGKSIQVGQEIEWTKSRGACCLKCAKAAEPLYNSPPPVDSAGNVDPAEAAAKFGRTALSGATVVTFSVHGLARGDNGDENGSIHFIRGKRYVQIARSSRRYLSRDVLDDFDMFNTEPGGSYDWQGVEIEATGDERAKDEAKAMAAADAKAWKDQQITDVRTGKIAIAAFYHDGEYLSGWDAGDKQSAELLVRLGLAKHVRGWGCHILDAQLESFLSARRAAEKGSCCPACHQQRAQSLPICFADPAQPYYWGVCLECGNTVKFGAPIVSCCAGCSTKWRRGELVADPKAHEEAIHAQVYARKMAHSEGDGGAV